MQRSVGDRVLARLRARGRGTVFTPSQVLDLGGRAAVDQALSRLVRRGEIRRLDRGLYDYPRKSRLFGTLPPDPDVVARALAADTGSRVQVGGARAANLLGLSDQVAARPVYLTDGPARTARVGRQTVELRRVSPRSLVAAGTTAGLVIQALRHLGREHVSDGVIGYLQDRLSAEDKRVLARESHKAPAWMRPYLEAISQGGSLGSDCATRPG